MRSIEDEPIAADEATIIPFDAVRVDARKAKKLALIEKWRSPEYQVRRKALETGPSTEQADAEAKAAELLFRPIRFVYRPVIEIPRRECLYVDHYFRKFVSGTVAPGGVGKSSLSIAEAVAMMLQKEWFGPAPDKELKCWYINGEEPEDEMERRIAAVCEHHGVDRSQLTDRLFTNSMRMKLASYDRNGNVVLNEAAFAALEQGIRVNGIDVTYLDPWVSFHGLKESDNDGIDVVVKRLAKVANDTNSSIEIIHHTRKPAAGLTIDLTTDDARGASALMNGCRAGRVLNRMSTKIAGDLGIEDKERHLIFRVDDDKRNLRPATDARWCKLASVPPANGDNVQAAEAWKYPDAFAGVTTTMMHDVRHEVGLKDYREDSRSPEWVGHLLAKKLHLNMSNPKDKATAKSIIKKWIENGVLTKDERLDKHGKAKSFLIAGDWDDEGDD
jgi:hypothetical protein